MDSIKKTKKTFNNLISGFLEKNNITDDFEQTVVKIIAPSLILYTKWTLEDAKKNDFKKLLFLMRDGKILYEIAEIIKTPLEVNTDNSLLYCSRNSLRQACYHLGGVHLDLLFKYTTNISLYQILERIFEKNEIVKFCKEMHISDNEVHKPLTKKDVQYYQNFIQSSNIAMELINTKSKYVFDCCKGYFDSFGIYSPEKTAIVDVGWRGTMLMSIQNIIKQTSTKTIDSYLYGMLLYPQGINKKHFHYFAFSKNKNVFNKTAFNINLFECFCGDYNGSTHSYTKEGDKFIPVLEKPNPLNQQTYKTQQNLIIKFTKYLIENCDINQLNNKYAIKLIKRICAKPTQQEAETLNRYRFSNLTNENSLSPLCTKLSFKQLLCCGLIGRILHTLHLIKVDIKYPYWTEGSIAISDCKHKKFLLFNYRIFTLARHFVYLFKKNRA